MMYREASINKFPKKKRKKKSQRSLMYRANGLRYRMTTQRAISGGGACGYIVISWSFVHPGGRQGSVEVPSQ